MPTYSQIISYVLDFVSDYVVFFAGGAVVALMVWAARALAHADNYMTADDMVGFDGNFEGAEEAEQYAWVQDH